TSGRRSTRCACRGSPRPGERGCGSKRRSVTFAVIDPHLASTSDRWVARAELVHFERLQEVLRARGIGFRRQVPAEYARKLSAFARSWTPAKLVDDLLIAALIEARSRERFARLAAAPIDEALRVLFTELADVETRHAGLYVEQAGDVAPGEDVAARWRALCDREAEILETPE